MATAGAVKIYVEKIVNVDISSPINLWKCRNLWKYAPEIKESNLTFRNNEIYNDSEEEQPEYGIDLDADQLTNTIIIEGNKINPSTALYILTMFMKQQLRSPAMK
ncbi:MAG TPA: hypothetical protein PKY23_00820 [Bacillota bacterium]|nr:hypothetical protein [Bacillota bacterium]